jgi:hypothetical protein
MLTDEELLELCRDALDVATEEVVRLQAENAELHRRLHREWNGKTNPFRCPVCGHFVKIEEAQLDMNNNVLYLLARCRTHGLRVPAGRWTAKDIIAALPSAKAPRHA